MLIHFLRSLVALFYSRNQKGIHWYSLQCCVQWQKGGICLSKGKLKASISSLLKSLSSRMELESKYILVSNFCGVLFYFFSLLFFVWERVRQWKLPSSNWLPKYPQGLGLGQAEAGGWVSYLGGRDLVTETITPASQCLYSKDAGVGSWKWEWNLDIWVASVLNNRPNGCPCAFLKKKNEENDILKKMHCCAKVIVGLLARECRRGSFDFEWFMTTKGWSIHSFSQFNQSDIY